MKSDFDRPAALGGGALPGFGKVAGASSSLLRMKEVASLTPERPVLRILARIEPVAKRAATG